MAHDPHANALIQSMKTGRKQMEEKEHVFYDKFIVKKQVPTAHDVEELAKVVKQMHDVSNLMHADLLEVQKAIQGFGGSGVTVLMGADTLLRTVKSKVPH